jgi:dihydroorotase
MNVLVRKAQLIYPGHKLHLKTLDILLQNGKIKTINPKTNDLPNKIQEIKSKKLKVSPGWLDLRANFGEPGFEERETIKSGCRAALAGGFTGVCLSPELHPVTDNRSTVEYLKGFSGKYGVDLYPLGAITVGLKGTDLAEMQDMSEGGAIAFSDGKNCIQNPRLMQLALDYAQGVNSLVMSFCLDKNLKGAGEVNEGPTSTRLGLKGIANLAEELMVNRDLYLTQYTGGRIHLCALSSGHSADLVAQAKKKGLNVSCDVSAIQLAENDGVLDSFDSNYKVLPPLRSEKDQKELTNRTIKETVDVICSDHTPHNIENKDCEFERASFGISSIQTVYPLLKTRLKDKMSDELFVEKVALNPRKVLGMHSVKFEEGFEANLTLFDPSVQWTFDLENNQSKSNNSPYLGESFTGKVIGTVNRGIVSLNV